MKVGEVGVYLHDPVRLNKHYGADEDIADRFREERLDLHPCNDIVQRPGGVQEDGGDGEPPGVDWAGEEQPESLPDTKDELDLISMDVSRHVNVDSLQVESTRWLSAVVTA